MGSSIQKSSNCAFIAGLYCDILFNRDQFYQFGELRSVSIVKTSQCAFVQYTQRSAAETAAEKTFNKLIINGKRWNIKWGKSQAQMGMGGKDGSKLEGEEGHTNPVPGLPGGMYL